MILKRLKLFGLIAIVASATIFACKDDFTEEDFLKLQNDLAKEKEKRDSAYLEAMTQEQAESYIAALNEAGDLMSVTILVRDENTPVAGVSVSIGSGAIGSASGRTQDIVTVVTDAEGRAVFERVVIGDNVISLTKADYVSASARVDFGTPPIPVALTTTINGTQVTRYVAPTKRFENFALPLFSETETEGNTAVVQGTFRIDNDLTNDPLVNDQVPAGLTIAANMANALSNAGLISSSCNCVNNYYFSGAAGSLGVAPIDPTTGAFSMRVPATASGLLMSFISPTIVGTQRIAVRRLNGEDIEPEFRDVPVRWEPGAAATPNIPVIPGARAVFSYSGNDTPAPAGRGFTINNFTPVPSPLNTGLVSSTGNTTIGNTTYRINGRGLNYSSSPDVTITGGGGADAEAESFLRVLVRSASITNGGSGYNGSGYTVEFTYVDQNGTTVPYATAAPVVPVGGVLPLGELTLPNIAGFLTNNPFITPNQIQGIGQRIIDNDTGLPATPTTPAVIDPDRVTELGGIEITNGGSGYTSAPIIEFDGGDPESNASVSVAAFRTQFDFSLPTGVATTPYRVLPASIVFTYAGNAVDGHQVENGGLVNLIDPVGTVSLAGENIMDHVMTDGTNILPLNTARSFRTNRAWTAPPSISVVDRTIQAAAANLSISPTTGEILAITNPSTDLGSSNNLLIPSSANTITGQGYDGITVQIVPTISGAPGSDAVFSLSTTQDVNSRMVSWGGTSTRLSGGAGYQDNLNRTTATQTYVAPGVINVQTGKVYFVTVNAGTGVRLENIDN